MEGRNFANKSLLLLDGEPRGLLQAIVGPPLKPADLKPIPRDALAAAAFRLDPQLAVAGIRASIENLSPDQKEVWGGIDDLKNVLSGDTCRDVLKALGDKWCVYSSPGEGLWPIAVVSLRNPEAIKRSLDKLPESGTSNNGDVLEMTFLPFKRFRFAGCDVYCFASDYIAAAWTVTGREMVFGLSPQSVKAYLAHDAKYESMQDAPKIIEPFSGENGPSLWAYSDSLSLLKLAYGTSMFYEPGTTRALREAGVEPKMIDFSLWPSPTALYRHVDPSTATVPRTDRGIEIVSRGTIPMPGVIDSGLLLSAPMAFSEEDKRPVALPSSVPAKPAAEKTPAGKAPEEGRLELRDTLKGHTHFVFCVAFSPDGKTLASGSFTGTVTLWDVASRLNIATVKGSKPVESVAFSPDGKTLASGSWNQTIKLWDVREGTEPDHVKEQVQPPEKE